jgi:DNA-binding response OmpR family regulator
MRRQLVLTTVLMAAFASSPWANAATHSTTTVNDYSWSGDGQAFGLHSQTSGHGVVVTRVEPEPFHGLRRGDVLVAADGKPLHQVEELMRILRGRTTPLALQVQRGQRWPPWCGRMRITRPSRPRSRRRRHRRPPRPRRRPRHPIESRACDDGRPIRGRDGVLMPMPNVLVIDDNPAVATALETLFSLHDIGARAATSPEEGLALLARESFDLVVQDMNFHADTTSGDEGIALFAQIRARHPDLPVILLTAWTSLESAVDLVKAGAADYLAKPWDDRKLLATVNNLLELSEARRELARHRRGEQRRRNALEREYDLRGFVFADAASERVLALACQVARSDLPVLVTGPNGAGKEKIAEIVHANSAVKDGPSSR